MKETRLEHKSLRFPARHVNISNHAIQDVTEKSIITPFAMLPKETAQYGG